MSDARILFGFHAIGARLRRDPESVLELYVAAGRRDARTLELLAAARAAGARVIESDLTRIAGMAGRSAHQGVVARVRASESALTLESVLDALSGAALLLVLDGVQDPHNLGACLRVADAFGADGVIAPKDRAAGITAAVAKVASGAAETVPFVHVTNLARALAQMKEAGIWVMGADQAAAEALSAARLDVPIAWVLGSEAAGLRRLTRETCDQVLRIPMRGTVGSLNVSVAAGICLYETCRQRELKRG